MYVVGTSSIRSSWICSVVVLPLLEVQLRQRRVQQRVECRVVPVRLVPVARAPQRQRQRLARRTAAPANAPLNCVFSQISVQYVSLGWFTTSTLMPISPQALSLKARDMSSSPPVLHHVSSVTSMPSAYPAAARYLLRLVNVLVDLYLIIPVILVLQAPTGWSLAMKPVADTTPHPSTNCRSYEYWTAFRRFLSWKTLPAFDQVRSRPCCRGGCTSRARDCPSPCCGSTPWVSEITSRSVPWSSNHWICERSSTGIIVERRRPCMRLHPRRDLRHVVDHQLVYVRLVALPVVGVAHVRSLLRWVVAHLHEMVRIRRRSRQ